MTLIDVRLAPASGAKADIPNRRFVPKAAVSRCSEEHSYSITSSARASRCPLSIRIHPTARKCDGWRHQQRRLTHASFKVHVISDRGDHEFS
jgi:hypothetical protein